MRDCPGWLGEARLFWGAQAREALAWRRGVETLRQKLRIRHVGMIFAHDDHPARRVLRQV